MSSSDRRPAVRRPQTAHVRPVGYRPGGTVQVPRGTPETIISHSLADLRGEIKRGAKRGEYAAVGQYERTAPAEYRVVAWRIRPRPPAWRKPVIIAGSVAAGIGAVFGLGWWVLTSIGAALTGSGSVIAGWLLIIALAAVLLTPARKPIAEIIIRIYR